MVGSSQVALGAQLAPAALERSMLAYVVAKLPDSTWVHLIAADGQVWKAKPSNSQGKRSSQPKKDQQKGHGSGQVGQGQLQQGSGCPNNINDCTLD